MVILLWCYILFFLFIQQFLKQTYLGELFLSFLPFLFLLHLIARIRIGIKMGQSRYHKKAVLAPIATLFFAIHVITLQSSREILMSYGGLQIQSATTTEEPLTIFYANIRKDNTQIQELQSLLEEYNADIVLLTEFRSSHQEALADYLSTNYEYLNRARRSDEQVGTIIFSKFPIENLAPQSNQWPWKYGFVRIIKNEISHIVYLIHTSSPVSYQSFINRNRQLRTLTSNIQRDQQQFWTPDDHIIMIGDFNLTPWSSYYQPFNQIISNTLTQTLPISSIFYTSWRFEYLPVAKAFIDHVWLSESIDFVHHEKVIIPGSDHDGLYLELIDAS